MEVNIKDNFIKANGMGKEKLHQKAVEYNKEYGYKISNSECTYQLD